MDERLIQVDERFVQVDERLVRVDGSLVEVDGRLVQVTGRLVEVTRGSSRWTRDSSRWTRGSSRWMGVEETGYLRRARGGIPSLRCFAGEGAPPCYSRLSTHPPTPEIFSASSVLGNLLLMF